MKKIILLLFMASFGCSATVLAQSIPPGLHARIIQLEDERNLNGDELAKLLRHASPKVRARAALAIGRIGDKSMMSSLARLLILEKDDNVKAMAIFALGELEDRKSYPILSGFLIRSREPLQIQARAAEAVGKVVAIAENASELGSSMVDACNHLIIKRLPEPATNLTPDQKLLASLSITALMRIRSATSIEPLAGQLKSADADIRAQAANALSRIRQPIASAVPALLEALNDNDHNVRANAARALGVSKDAQAVEPLIKSLGDKSEQVQVSVIRALATIGDKRAVEPLVEFGKRLLEKYEAQLEEIDRKDFVRLPSTNLLLEISVALGTFRDKRGLHWLYDTQRRLGELQPEIETAIGRIEDDNYPMQLRHGLGWLSWKGMVANIQGLAANQTERARDAVKMFLERVDFSAKLKNLAESKMFDERSIPELLRAIVRLKDADAEKILSQKLTHKDLIVRATAAQLLADFQNDQNLASLTAAFAVAKADKENDAKLSILNALSKYKSEKAVETVKAALNDSDHLVRRRAVDLLKQMGAGDFSDRIGTVKTGHDKLFYQRVVARTNRKVTATLHTDKGLVTMELFPAEAPITVESFIRLARKGYFNNVTFHRVVPNFVIQGGDPQGTGEGGPGYQIRCEVNTRPYVRGAVGMALSGKDTGGSQFFITHSPQPHLDGGYTVFGQVTDGMEVVDRIARGDTIRRIQISEK